MNSFVITLFATVTLSGVLAGNDLKKCCKPEEYYENVNGSYYCVHDETRRLQILTNETDFVGKQNEGECVEVSDGFFLFNISDREVIKVSPARGKVYPKCCPLNFIYNSIIHACQEKEDTNHSFIKENFIKVGVPNCRVVVDYKLNGTTDYEYGLLESKSRYLRRNSLQYFGSYCIDETEEASLVIRECKESIEICEEVKCIKKCCPDGQSFIDGSNCKDTYRHGLNLSAWANAVNKPTGNFFL